MHVDLKSFLGLVAFTLMLAAVVSLSACSETRSLPGYATGDSFKPKPVFDKLERWSGGGP
jgi:hypothetical protein